MYKLKCPVNRTVPPDENSANVSSKTVRCPVRRRTALTRYPAKIFPQQGRAAGQHSIELTPAPYRFESMTLYAFPPDRAVHGQACSGVYSNPHRKSLTSP